MPCRLALTLLVPLAGMGLLSSAKPALSENHVAAESRADPAAARIHLREKAGAMEIQLTLIIAEIDSEIARQENSAGFGASERLLSQIDRLKARRDTFSDQLKRVRVLIAGLDGSS